MHNQFGALPQRIFLDVKKKKGQPKLTLCFYMVGRAGLEPATNGLKDA